MCAGSLSFSLSLSLAAIAVYYDDLQEYH